MTVTHIVSFRFKDSVSEKDRERVHNDFLHLKGGCQRENDGGGYIIDLIGGKKNTSPEGAGKDFDNSYVVTFVDEADRDYYVHKDPVHAGFAKLVRSLVSDAFIYDFEH